MDREEPTGRNPLRTRRAFVRSRLEAEFEACAYEILVPTVGRIACRRNDIQSCRLGVGTQRLLAAGA